MNLFKKLVTTFFFLHYIKGRMKGIYFDLYLNQLQVILMKWL